jgi:hypothetical protein
MDYLFLDKYRQLFNEHIEQALDYIKNLKEDDFKAKVCFLDKIEIFINKIFFYQF